MSPASRSRQIASHATMKMKAEKDGRGLAVFAISSSAMAEFNI
jgi:hypothetical protein